MAKGNPRGKQRSLECTSSSCCCKLVWERFSTQRLLWGNWLGSLVGRLGRGWDGKIFTCSKLVTDASALYRDLSTSQTLPSLLASSALSGTGVVSTGFWNCWIYLYVYFCVCASSPQYVLHMCTVLKEARRGCQVPRNQKYRGYELSNVDTRNGSQGLCKSISILNRLSHFSKAKMVLKWSSQDNSNEMISMKTIFQTHRWWPLNVRSMQRNNRGGELIPCRVCSSQG